ncbi:MAG TPA: glycoside hydrolase family 76 protein [Trebonia sp.]|nr:glycoside hydrolase family 76 protein [Trebonia sp.]
MNQGPHPTDAAERGRPDYRSAAREGIEVLQRWYSRRTGLWKTSGWWNAANALTAVIRYSQSTGDRSYLGVIENTFTAAQRGFIWPQRPKPGFINDFFDDNLWWALAWVAACDLTGDERYHVAARAIFAHSLSGWDGTCGGGLWWNEKRDYKNAITNELFLTLAALLAARVPGRHDYRDWALREWEWLYASGLIGPSGLVNDGLNAACANNGGVTWTYNQGVILGGLAALHELTGDQGYLRQGEAIAGAALRSLVDQSGILAEPCEFTAAGCGGDGTQFKGIFVRYLHDFWRHSGTAAYPAFILANADSVLANAGNRDGQYGLRWSGPFDKADASRQTSAVEVLTAAAALPAASAPA